MVANEVLTKDAIVLRTVHPSFLCHGQPVQVGITTHHPPPANLAKHLPALPLLMLIPLPTILCLQLVAPTSRQHDV